MKKSVLFTALICAALTLTGCIFDEPFEDITLTTLSEFESMADNSKKYEHKNIGTLDLSKVPVDYILPNQYRTDIITDNGDSIDDVSYVIFEYNLYNVQNIILPDNLKGLSEFFFEEVMLLESIQISEDNEYYCTDDGVLYTKDKVTIYKYPPCKTGSTFTLPEETSVALYQCFYYNQYLEEINGSEQLKPAYSTTCSIFNSMYKLKNLELSFTSCPGYTLNYCSSLEEVTFTTTEKMKWSYNVIYDCPSLKKITFSSTEPPEIVIANEKYEFQECSSDLKFYVPAGSKENYLSEENSFYQNNAYKDSLEERIIEYEAEQLTEIHNLRHRFSGGIKSGSDAVIFFAPQNNAPAHIQNAY